MLRSLDDLLGLIGRLYPGNPPPPFLLLEGVKRVKAGERGLHGLAVDLERGVLYLESTL